MADYSLADFCYETHPILTASLYKSVGYALTVVSPLTLSYSPSQVSRLGNFLPGHYEPPERSWLHDGPYQLAVDQVGIEADTPWITMAFPVNQRPYVPDIIEEKGDTLPAVPDSDGDGMDDYGEAVSGTDPCDGAAYFRFDALTPTPTAGGFAVRWIGRANRRYRLHRQLSLLPGSPAEEVTNVVPVGGVAPWYAVPVEVEIPAAHPAAWYRVTVDPE